MAEILSTSPYDRGGAGLAAAPAGTGAVDLDDVPPVAQAALPRRSKVVVAAVSAALVLGVVAGSLASRAWAALTADADRDARATVYAWVVGGFSGKVDHGHLSAAMDLLVLNDGPRPVEVESIEAQAPGLWARSVDGVRSMNPHEMLQFRMTVEATCREGAADVDVVDVRLRIRSADHVVRARRVPLLLEGSAADHIHGQVCGSPDGVSWFGAVDAQAGEALDPFNLPNP